MEEVYYIVPKDVVHFEYSDDTQEYAKIIPQELISYNRNGCKAIIEILPIPPSQINNLQAHNIRVNQYQILIKVKVEYDIYHLHEYTRFEGALRKYLILSLILANNPLDVFLYDGTMFTSLNGNGQGIFLPYSFIKLTNDNHVNLYYESEHGKLTYSHSYSLFNIRKVTLFK